MREQEDVHNLTTKLVFFMNRRRRFWEDNPNPMLPSFLQLLPQPGVVPCVDSVLLKGKARLSPNTKGNCGSKP